MNLLIQKMLSRMGSPLLIASFILGLLGVNASTVFGQAAPSLNVSSARTCGSPISVTATCTAGNTPTFIASGGSASGNVYTYTAQGSYTITATCSNGSGTSSAATPVSVRIFAPTSPPTLTPTSATVTQGGAPVTITPSGCPGGYISYFGTMGVNREGNIIVPTGTAGVITISAICTINDCQSVPTVANITVTPSSTSIPQPTVVSPIPSQTGTVGNTFTFLIPPSAFSDPNNDPLTLTASGLPSGLSFNGLFITGPLNTAGVFPITITASNNRGGSASTTFQLTVSPATPPTSTTGGPLQLLTPTYDACSRVIVFNTTGGNGTPITFTAIGVQRANDQSPTGIVEANVVADNKTLIIEASQSGVTVAVNFTPPACTNPPTSTTSIGGPLVQTQPTYDPCTRVITFNTTGGDGTPITYQAIGVQRANAQSNTGLVELGIVLDNKTLNISATQSGTTSTISFTPPQCTSPPTSTTTTGSPIQMLPPTYNPCTRVIIFNTTGGNGSAITYQAIGVQRSTPQSTSGVVEAGIVQDNKTLSLVAFQNGQSSTISFTPPQCTTTPPPTSTTATGGPIQMLPPTYDPCTRAITLNTTGGDGTVITYQAIGVQRASAQSNTGFVEPGIVQDSKTLNLVATQSGQTSSISFTPPMCPSAREAIGTEGGPKVTVLGNPANGSEITIEVVTVEKQVLQVRLIDPQGQAVHNQTVQSPNAVERVVIPVRSSQKGIFMIQAISGGKASVTKVLHQ